MNTELILQAAGAVNQAILAHESEIESLDREIGDRQTVPLSTLSRSTSK